MKTKVLICLSATLLLGACATPTVVQSVKPGDGGLSCAQLQNEYADAERLKTEAAETKGVTGGNIARLLFWPAIVGTHMNANEAIAAADNRKVHLANQMQQRNCAIPGGMQVAENKIPDTTSTVATAPQSKEAQLSELKRLFDANLITKEVYAERQKTILETQ